MKAIQKLENVTELYEILLGTLPKEEVIFNYWTKPNKTMLGWLLEFYNKLQEGIKDNAIWWSANNDEEDTLVISTSPTNVGLLIEITKYFYEGEERQSIKDYYVL